MKRYLIVGGSIGCLVGLSLSVFPIPGLHWLSLAFVWDWLIIGRGDVGEAMGWLLFVYTTVVGVGYGYVVYRVLQKVR